MFNRKSKKAIKAIKSMITGFESRSDDVTWLAQSRDILNLFLGPESEIFIQMASLNIKEYALYPMTAHGSNRPFTDNSNRVIALHMAAIEFIKLNGLYKPPKSDLMQLMSKEGFWALFIATFGAGVSFGYLICKFINPS